MSLVSTLKWRLARRIERMPYVQHVLRQVLLRATFMLPHDRCFLAFRQMLEHPCKLFLDVGANDGMSALSFRRLDQSFEILSIEPSPYHEPSLRRIRQRDGRFDYLLVGAGDEVGSFELHTPIYRGVPLHTAASLSRAQAAATIAATMPEYVSRQVEYGVSEVSVICLDDLDLAPGIVKIDAEGFDYRVLLGMQQTIERHRPYVMVERDDKTLSLLRDWCKNLDYGVLQYSEQSDTFSDYDAEKVRNIFCIPLEGLQVLPQQATSPHDALPQYRVCTPPAAGGRHARPGRQAIAGARKAA